MLFSSFYLSLFGTSAAFLFKHWVSSFFQSFLSSFVFFHTFINESDSLRAFFDFTGVTFFCNNVFFFLFIGRNFFIVNFFNLPHFKLFAYTFLLHNVNGFGLGFFHFFSDSFCVSDFCFEYFLGGFSIHRHKSFLFLLNRFLGHW